MNNKEKKQLQKIEETMDQQLIETAIKSNDIYNNLLNKAKDLESDEFDEKQDNFILKVADSALNHVHKTLDRQLKARLVKKEEITMFHQLLKEANAGNIQDLDEYEIEDN